MVIVLYILPSLVSVNVPTLHLQPELNVMHKAAKARIELYKNSFVLMFSVFNKLLIHFSQSINSFIFSVYFKEVQNY
jgi:hypothetical protein